MRSLIVCQFPKSGKTYDYYAEGSSNELAGAALAQVTTPYGIAFAYVKEIRPLSEQTFDGTLKPVDKLYYERESF